MKALFNYVTKYFKKNKTTERMRLIEDLIVVESKVVQSLVDRQRVFDSGKWDQEKLTKFKEEDACNATQINSILVSLYGENQARDEAQNVIECCVEQAERCLGKELSNIFK